MTERHDAATMDTSMELLLERKHLLDDVWLMSFFALFVAVGAPWYLRALEIDFAPVAWSLFGYGAFYTLGALAIDGLSKRRSMLLAIGVTQVSGVLFLGWIWHLTGSMQNPMFLLAFVLPVVAGSLVPVNWQAYGTAVLAFVIVLVVAIVDTPELRWFAAQLGSASHRFLAALPQNAGMNSQPFPSLNFPPAYYFVLIAMFAALVFTVALMTESLTSLLGHVSNRLESATRALGVAENLSSEVLRLAPLPAALVYSDTLQVAQVSESFLQHFFLSADSLLHKKDLFALVEFVHPEVIQAVISGHGGEIPVAAYRVDGEPRAARILVHPVNYGGRHYAYVNIQDITDLQTVMAAFNAVDETLIVLNAKQRVLYSNDKAKEMWGELEPGTDVALSLRKANLPDRWWELGMRSRQERRLELNGKQFVANCAAARILGEREALTVLTMRPAGGGS